MARKWSRLKILVLAGSLMAPLLGLGAGPALATTATSGEAAFQGSASLPTFPCQPPAPFGNGPCNGTFSGQWAGHLSGVSGTSPFDVEWSTINSAGTHVTASFTYAEWQCAEFAETILGIAQGTGTATVDPGQLQGKWQVVGESFARDIIGVNFTFSFKWTRVGTGAVLVLPSAVLQLNVSGIGWVTVITGLTQTGQAAFVPTTDGINGVPSCTNQGSISGVIAGTLPFAGAF